MDNKDMCSDPAKRTETHGVSGSAAGYKDNE
jgi:hypothetical protein